MADTKQPVPFLAASLGTVILKAVARYSDDPDAPKNYVLLFQDTDSGETAEVSADGEADAVNLFAAWLTIDEIDSTWSISASNRLHEALLGTDFLP